MPEFDDPFRPPDATVVRPRPGAGRRTTDPPSQAPAPQRPASAGFEPESAPVVSADSLGVGLNPLVRAASSLLMLSGQLRGTLSGPDIPSLRRYVLDEIRRFEDRARAGGVANEVVLAARYAICAALDEAVLSTPWGAQSEWAQQTLLVALHREAWGGEKFFDMLDRVAQDPKRHIDLMELLYLCMTFGFAGKYQVEDRGHSRLSDVQNDLYRKIREYRGAPPTELSLRWKGLQDRRNPLIRYVPWWVVGAAALAIVVVTYGIYLVKLGAVSSPVYDDLAKLGTVSRKIPPPPPNETTLKKLLEEEEKQGLVAIVVDGGRTKVVLAGDNMFSSGSATISSEYRDRLRVIAEALKKVPGRVVVVGHTDDRPVRGIKYQSNVELSWDRARNVAGILQELLGGQVRLDTAGRGSAEPRSQPPSDPKNRRVEIVHERGGS
jgi:type VI secretion system protein ImpK